MELQEGLWTRHGDSVWSHEWWPKPHSRSGLVETLLLLLWAQILHYVLPTPLIWVPNNSTRTAKLPLEIASTSPEWILENVSFLAHQASMVKSGSFVSDGCVQMFPVSGTGKGTIWPLRGEIDSLWPRLIKGRGPQTWGPGAVRGAKKPNGVTEAPTKSSFCACSWCCLNYSGQRELWTFQ